MTFHVDSPNSAGRQKGTVKKVLGKATHKGRERWRVSSDGFIKVVTTSGASQDAMDEAMTLYGRALKRLANR